MQRKASGIKILNAIRIDTVLSFVKYKIAKWILINFDHTVIQDILKHIHLDARFFTFAEDFNVLGLGVFYLYTSIIDADKHWRIRLLYFYLFDWVRIFNFLIAFMTYKVD